MAVEIPQGITVAVSADGLTVKANGPKGNVEKTFKAQGVKIKAEEGKVEVSAPTPALKGTLEAHVKNMVEGVRNGYVRKLKLIYAHFPFTLEVKGDKVNVKNLLGERQPRVFRLIGSTKVEAKGQEVTVSGPDKDGVGQTIANFRRALRIKKKDCRVFQDGAYEFV